ncbi:MAG: hypothetical protein Q9227_002360 [Pyrenula ochraceoflavens]
MADKEQEQQQPPQQPTDDTAEVQKGGILPEGWGEEDKPNPNDAYLGKYGNAAGDKIEGTLGKVGQPVGKGLGYATKPVGSLVEPVVGGLMKSGNAFGSLVKEEYGKPDSETQKEEMKKGLGNNEQDKDNPLGL